MLTYDKLTKSQKRWADAMMDFYPKLKQGGVITLGECYHASTTLYKQRIAGVTPKIGYPNWLFGVNKIRRGVYFFPAPGTEPDAAIQADSANNLQKRLDKKDAFEVRSEADEEFLNELLEAGIDIKVAQTQTESPL